jgi:hypothetical protein
MFDFTSIPSRLLVDNFYQVSEILEDCVVFISEVSWRSLYTLR